MACIINIETSTTVCSVTLAQDGAVILEKISFDGPAHAVLGGVYIEEVVAFARKQNLPIDAVAVSCGPGSYTGLRIGVSLAKGVCFGLNVPLISLPTLQVIAASAITQTQDKEAHYCAMIDARRMEVYAACYDASLNEIRSTAADIVTEETYLPLLADCTKTYFFGNGAAKCMHLIQAENAVLLEDIHPLATAMAPLSEAAFQAKRFEDSAYYEPYYLKEFVGTVAKNKVLGEVTK